MIPKFRAWYTPFGGSVKKFNKMKHGSAGSLLTHAEMSPDDYKIMQSTGLKDKNGVEIFEGDIVKIIGDVLDDDMSVIRFTEGGFYLDYKNLDTEFELLYSIDLPIEIIGNIYENPELLEAIE